MLNDFQYVWNLRKGRSKGLVPSVKAVLQVFFALSTYIVLIYRLSRLFDRCYLAPLAKLFWFFNMVVFKVDMDYRARIYGGVYFPHPFCIVIGKDVVIKGNLTALHNTTIGGTVGKSAYVEELGQISTQLYAKHSVRLSPGAIIIGPVLLNGNVVIGANAVLSKSIEYDALVMGCNDVRPLPIQMQDTF